MTYWISTFAWSSCVIYVSALGVISKQSRHWQRITAVNTQSLLIRRNASAGISNHDTNDNMVVPTQKRILCLHGKGNDGQSFQEKLRPLEEKLEEMEASSSTSAKRLKFQFDYLDAPFHMKDNENSREWWALPPGVRSFNAKEYQGYSVSKMTVENTMKNHDYDFIFGHSQGAILLATLISSKDWDLDTTVKGYIFNGVAWPNPFSEQMETFPNQGVKMDKTLNSVDKKNLLFIIGDSDSVNPPEGAVQVRNVMSKHRCLNVDTIHHKGGHSVPVKDEVALNSIVHWILNVSRMD